MFLVYLTRFPGHGPKVEIRGTDNREADWEASNIIEDFKGDITWSCDTANASAESDTAKLVVPGNDTELEYRYVLML